MNSNSSSLGEPARQRPSPDDAGARAASFRRPRPVVHHAAPAPVEPWCGQALIAVTQRDDTLLLIPSQARRLARDLLRAAALHTG